MAKDRVRVSRTGVTSGGRIALYTNSKEVSDLDPSLVRFIAGNSLSSLVLTSANFDDDLYSSDTYVITQEGGDSGENDDGGQGSSGEGSLSSSANSFLRAPSLADIEIVSQSVVYDASGQPSVTVIFKVKNSSGSELKGMNARIELR